jgi:hypothetical protein
MELRRFLQDGRRDAAFAKQRTTQSYRPRSMKRGKGQPAQGFGVHPLMHCERVPAGNARC